MTRRTPSRKHTTAKATLVFLLCMAQSWWVLALALTGQGCSFEPSAIGKHPKVTQWSSDNDGGE